MGPFGASHYSLSFFVPFHPKLPPSDDWVPRPDAATLGDAWKGLGLTYFLLKGLKKTSKTLKLIKDSVEGMKKDVPGTSGASVAEKGICRSVTAKNPVGVRPISIQNTAGYGLRKISRNAGQVSSHTNACKIDTLGVCGGEQKNMSPNAQEDIQRNDLYETATVSSTARRLSTKESVKEFGLGLEGVMTTITGFSQQAHYKNEMEGIITVVKTADRVVEGVKAAKGVIQTFSSPFGDALLSLGVGNGVVLGVNTVKIVLKGVKISKGLVTVTKLCKNKQTGAIGAGAEMAIKSDRNILGHRLKVFVKGLKASEGAANVVTISKEVGKTLGMLDKAELFSWGIIMKGLKFTKSAIRVLEPLGSLHWGVISAVGKGMLEVKGVVEGIGYVVKAIVLSKELYVVLLKGVGFTKGAMAALNEFKRRSLRSKQSLKSEEPTAIWAGDYSVRNNVTFRELRRRPEFTMPNIAWSLTETESNSFVHGWDFTKEVNVYGSRSEFSEDVEVAIPLSFPILTIAGCEL